MAELNKSPRNLLLVVLIPVVFAYLLARACLEFYAVAWGTGVWVGEFSFKWGLGFFVFSLFCLFTLVLAVVALWRPALFGKFAQRLIAFRSRLNIWRWVVIAIIVMLPVWFLQFTSWGIVFHGLYFRLMLWGYIALAQTIFIERSEKIVSWLSLLIALLLSSTVFSIAFAFINVSSYPFSIGWSEGNRLWDYSVLFGSELYDYPVDSEIYSLTDIGRQFVGGLPFLLPNVTISVERFWVGLTTIIPYILLGLAAFRSEFKNKKLWLLLGLFTFVFLKQGPIHPPLVLSAFVVALLWRRPLWLAVPLIFLTSYFTEMSRYTWLFAPGIWIVMLEFSGALLKNRRLQKRTWWRAAVLGSSGVLGGYLGPNIINWIKALFVPGESAVFTGGGAISISSVSSSVSQHPLLWYRLLPSATSGMGILPMLIIAVAPIVTILIYLAVNKKWAPINWQKTAILSPLTAFLIVGLIASTKAGGGGDLHNLDMFMIGLMFTAVIAWENGGRQWLRQIESSPILIKATLVLLLLIPGIQPLSALRSYHFSEDISWLVTLTDVSDAKFLGMFPPRDEADYILQTIRQAVAEKESQGDVLFLDQRQLLTFGYVKDVPLVPEYEKKVLMNEAMADNVVYFSSFYADLKAGRFSLIVTEPLRAPVKDSSYEFGEENNAWVKWVVEPVLCYYEEIETYKNPQIQLLVPRQGDFDCSSKLPTELAN